jgi:hypothetical protein
MQVLPLPFVLVLLVVELARLQDSYLVVLESQHLGAVVPVPPHPRAPKVVLLVKKLKERLNFVLVLVVLDPHLIFVKKLKENLNFVVVLMVVPMNLVVVVLLKPHLIFVKKVK